MPTRKPHEGEVWDKESAHNGAARLHTEINSRPPSTRGEGTRVRLSRFDETAKGVLKSPFVFQVPPLESLAVQHEFGWVDYQTVNAGTYSRPAGRALRIVSFQTLFIDYHATWSLIDFTTFNWSPHPIKMAKELREILNSGTPFELLIGQPRLWGANNHDLRMKATLRSLGVEERAGEIDARYIDVAFTEWREMEVKRGQKSGGGGGHSRNTPTTHTIVDGDTLRALAKFYYGESSLWRVIAKANGLTQVRPEQDLSEVKHQGRRLKAIKIPALPGETTHTDSGLEIER